MDEESPVKVEKEYISFDPEKMVANRVYRVYLDDETYVLVKTYNGDVDIFKERSGKNEKTTSK